MPTCIDYFDSDDSKCDAPGRVKLSAETCEGQCNENICCPQTCGEWVKGSTPITRDCGDGEVPNNEHYCTSENLCSKDVCCIEGDGDSDSSTTFIIIGVIFGIITLAIAIGAIFEFRANHKSDKFQNYLVFSSISLFIVIYLGIQTRNKNLRPKEPRFLMNLLVIPMAGIVILNAYSIIGKVNISDLKKITLTTGELPTRKTAIIMGIIFLLYTIGEFYRVIKEIIDKPDSSGDPDEVVTTDTMKNINNYLEKNGIDEWVNILYVFIILILCILIKKNKLNDYIKGILVILLFSITFFKIISSINTSGEENFNFVSPITSIILTVLILYTLTYGKDIDLNKFIIPLLIFEIIIFIVYRNFYNVFSEKKEKDEDYETREISVIKVICLSLIITIILRSIEQLDEFLDSKKTILFFIVLTIFLLGITSDKWYERMGDPSTDETDKCAYDNSLINYNNNKQIEIDLELRKNVYIDDNILFFIIIAILFILILKDGDNIKDIGIFIIFIVSYSLIHFVGKLIKDEKITSFDMSINDEKTTCNEGRDSDCNSSDSTIYKRNKRGLLKCGSLSVTDFYIRRIAGISIKDIRDSQNTGYSTFQSIKFSIRLFVFFGIIYLIYKPVKKKFDKSYHILIMVTVIFMIIIPLFSRLLLSDSPLNDNPGTPDPEDPSYFFDNNTKNNVYYETIRDYMSYVFKNPFSRALSKRESVYKDDGTMNTVNGIRYGSDDKDDCSENCNKTKPNFMNDYGGLMILLSMIIILVIKIVLKLF